LHRAVLRENLDIVKILVRAGADWNLQARNETPGKLADRSKKYKCRDYLLNLERKSKEGKICHQCTKSFLLLEKVRSFKVFFQIL
jgi:hypothetical protein